MFCSMALYTYISKFLKNIPIIVSSDTDIFNFLDIAKSVLQTRSCVDLHSQ